MNWLLYLLVLVVCVVCTVIGLKFKKKAGYVIYYLLPMVLLVWSFFSGSFFFVVVGIVSEVLLVWLLFVKPLAVIFKSKYLFKIVGFRRELGIAMFWFFFFHAVGLYKLYGMSFTSVISNTSLLWGLIAGVVLIIVALTSNNYSVKLLKNNWKRVQYLSYFVLFGVLLHSSLKTTMVKFYLVFGLFVVLKVVEWRKFFK